MMVAVMYRGKQVDAHGFFFMASLICRAIKRSTQGLAHEKYTGEGAIIYSPEFPSIDKGYGA